MSHRSRRLLALLFVTLSPVVASARTVSLPPGTAVFGSTDERVTSRIKKDGTDVGDVVRAHVWRDVIVDGQVVIQAGTPMFVRVSMVKKAKMAGIKGQIELESVSTEAADGTQVLLDGGYDKSGHGRMALSISLAAVVAWPLIFIHGKPAILESGTVFDCSVTSQQKIDVSGSSGAPRKLNLADTDTLAIDVLYDQMDQKKADKSLPLLLHRCGGAFSGAQIVTVNEQDIPPIPMVVGASEKDDGGCLRVRTDANLEQLGKHFTRGINRFEIQVGDDRAEVLLDIEM